MQYLKILFLLLFFTATTNLLKAQEKEHEYLPLFAPNKTWNVMIPGEYDDYYEQVLTIDSTNYFININDTIYYSILDNNYFEYGYFREDKLEQKIYKRDNESSNEILIYDFSMEVGDSIPTCEGSYIYMDSIKTEDFFGVERNVYYLTDKGHEGNIVWIEGIGSLAGVPFSYYSPEIYWTGSFNYYLSCYYENEELSYLSYYGNLWGCHFEIDHESPQLHEISIEQDTVALNEQITAWVHVSDQSPINITATFTSPNQNAYSISNFSLSDSIPYAYKATFSDFNNEPGDWYLSKIHIEDAQNNITEGNYNSNCLWAKFYVTNTIGINQISNDKFRIYPNPVTNISKLNFENNNKTAEIKIFDATGRLIEKSITTNNFYEITTDNFNKGIYIFTINIDNRIINGKFLIQ